MPDKVNLGVISYAHPHASKYAATIVAHPKTDLIGIAGLGVNSDLAASEASRYGIPYYQDYRELLDCEELTGVYIGTEPRHHLEVVRHAASQGKHILCDKPIALTLDEGEEIIERAAQAGVRLMVPFNPRFQLPLMKLKEALVEGEAGNLVSIFAIKYGKLPTTIPGPADFDWLVNPQLAGGGGFLDIGIHAVDALRWLADSEAQTVYAHTGSMLHSDLAVDDLGLMTVVFENGVVGTLSAGWANPDAYPTWLDVRFEVLTTRTAFLISSPYHSYAAYSQTQTQRLYWWRKDIYGLVGEFAQAVAENREPRPSGRDAQAALAICLAAYESSRSGRVVHIT